MENAYAFLLYGRAVRPVPGIPVVSSMLTLEWMKQKLNCRHHTPEGGPSQAIL
jgi:hypothetical protein